MIFVGIDVAKEKHDCFIINSNNEIIKNVFSFKNNIEGFKLLLTSIPNVPKKNIKIGLEATGHYSINLINFIINQQLPLTVFNPLQTNLFRKAQTLRKSKTDRIDAKLITMMLRTGNFEPYTHTSYYINELKTLTRHKSRIRDNLSKYKISLNRIIDIMFPELASAVYSINQNSTYALLKSFPSKKSIAKAHLTKLTNILKSNSSGKYSKDKAIQIKELASKSIGTDSPSLSFELTQTIEFIEYYQNSLNQINEEIEKIMNEIHSPITSIPGISYGLGSIILSEIGNISNFNSPSKLLAFSGLEPSTYESGKFVAQHMKMVKRGSPYLRWALLQAARTVAMRDNTFKSYYLKKKNEGKHYFIALSHVAKKLVRVIYHILTNNIQFKPQS